MDEKQYNSMVTDFYSKISIDIALGKHNHERRIDTGELLRTFVSNLNKDLAAPLLSNFII